MARHASFWHDRAMTWLQAHPDGAAISVHLSPGARRTSIVGFHGEALKIKVQAPPVEGKANAALRDFLAATLGVPKSAVLLVRGESSRDKVVAVRGLSAEEARTRLAPHLPASP